MILVKLEEILFRWSLHGIDCVKSLNYQARARAEYIVKSVYLIMTQGYGFRIRYYCYY